MPYLRFSANWRRRVLSHSPLQYCSIRVHVLERLSYCMLSSQQDTEPCRTIDRSDKQGHSLGNFTPHHLTTSHVCTLVTKVNSPRFSAGRQSGSYVIDRIYRHSLTLIPGSRVFTLRLFHVRHLAFGIIEATTRRTSPGVSCDQGVRPESPICKV